MLVSLLGIQEESDNTIVQSGAMQQHKLTVSGLAGFLRWTLSRIGVHPDKERPSLHPAGQYKREETMEPSQPGEKVLCGGDETILLVDDEFNVIEIAKDILEQFGYNVLTATDGEQALEMISDAGNMIDLIILDLGMPGMGGEHCLAELKKLNSTLRVAVCSGYSDHKIRLDPCSHGASAFLRKPYSLNELVALVREILDKREEES